MYHLPVLHTFAQVKKIGTLLITRAGFYIMPDRQSIRQDGRSTSWYNECSNYILNNYDSLRKAREIISTDSLSLLSIV